ncbi:hypothetical protein MYX84_04190 [Acidobacteria bacterium AH-259-O06]|nr:hypothetical protein [Acidobacteria bacterium AH-259-O06]
MRTKILLVGLVFGGLFALLLTASTEGKEDLLSGVWKGDFGPTPSDRNPVTLELKWDGKTLSGTINPGPEGIPIDKASFDAKEMKVRFEATYTPRNRHYVVEGKVEKDKMSGTWSRPGRNGDFKLSRVP